MRYRHISGTEPLNTDLEFMQEPWLIGKLEILDHAGTLLVISDQRGPTENCSLQRSCMTIWFPDSIPVSKELTHDDV